MKSDSMQKKEITFICLMLILALSLAWMSFSYPLSSSVYPRALSVFLIFLTICQFIVFYLKKKESIKENIEHCEENNEPIVFFSKKSIVIYVLSGVYLLGTTMLGFYTSTYLYVAGISIYLGCKNKTVAFIWPIILCILVWAVFSWFLHVPTPEGMLF